MSIEMLRVVRQKSSRFVFDVRRFESIGPSNPNAGGFNMAPLGKGLVLVLEHDSLPHAWLDNVTPLKRLVPVDQHVSYTERIGIGKRVVTACKMGMTNLLF